ncbi:MAG: hypothetical protein K0R23_3844 [Lacrimispora sp.]|jgi:hypothetical protein|nr:hypothetical protein [Lacrimispora sp.]
MKYKGKSGAVTIIGEDGLEDPQRNSKIEYDP